MPSRPVRRQCLRLAGATVAVYAVMAVAMLVGNGGRLESFVRFGADVPTLAIARDRIGPEVQPTSGEGFDGQYFWLQAHDPFLLDPALFVSGGSDAGYRTPRMLYPVLLAPSRIFGEQALMAWMLLLNLLVVGGGTYATARLSVLLGGPVQGGLAFALNPGMLTGVLQDVADPLALLLVVLCVLAFRHGRIALACVAGAAAVAAKEFSFLSIAGIAVLGTTAGTKARARDRVAVAGSAAATGLAIAGYVRYRFGFNTANQNIELVPFRGYLDSWQLDWSVNAAWFEAVASIGVLGLAVWAALRWWQRRTPELGAAALTGAAVPFLAGIVVRYAFNLSRVVAPLLLFLALDVMVTRAQARRGTAAPARPAVT